MTQPRTVHLSASAITAYKGCPTRFRLAYVEGLRLDEDTESQRVGTNWHKLHEVYEDAYRLNPDHEAAFLAAIDHLNETYKDTPIYKDPYDWATERERLAASFAGYHWYYQNQPIETLVTELEFKLPLYHPKTGLPLSQDDVIRPGKIDRVVRLASGDIAIRDYKSTSKPIDADSDFWNHLRLDTQISMYVLSVTELIASGALGAYGVARDARVSGAYYDVWHKPTIKPALLTQAETATFMETGEYQGQKYEVKITHEWNEVGTDEKGKEVTTAHKRVSVDSVEAEVKPGKKGFAIRETPGMYGARLLADIYERPTHYFARKEIPRTDDDLATFREQLYATYQSMKSARDSGHWIQNEHQCNATFRCAYTPICYAGLKVADGVTTPPGFKRIFSPLTISGEQVEL